MQSNNNVWSFAHQTKSVFIALRPQGNLVGDPITAKLTISDPDGDDGCITPNMNS